METKKVKKVLYIIIAILLGDLGIHQFYAGKVKRGIIYLVFCWTGIPEIFAIVDAIKACGKQADADGMIEV